MNKANLSTTYKPTRSLPHYAFQQQTITNSQPLKILLDHFIGI